jgi:hypothetical protein
MSAYFSFSNSKLIHISHLCEVTSHKPLLSSVLNYLLPIHAMKIKTEVMIKHLFIKIYQNLENETEKYETMR